MTDEDQGQDADEDRAGIPPIVPDSIAGSAEEEEETSDAVPEPALEMPDPAPDTRQSRVGTLDDKSDPHPILVNSSVPSASKPQQAYESLQIKTPIEEFHAYAGSRLETLVRLGEPERAELTSRALELGIEALRQVMGAVPREAQ